MDSSGINPNVTPPQGLSPVHHIQPDYGKDTEAMLFAALLAMMGVNSHLIRNVYMRKVLEGQKWVKAGTGIQGPLNEPPGSVTNQQWDAFAEGWQFMQKQVANWKAYKKTHPNAKTPLPIQQMENILKNPGLNHLYSILKKLQGVDTQLAKMKKRLENGKPIDLEKYKELKGEQKKLVKEAQTTLGDLQNPTGKNAAEKKAAWNQLLGTIQAYVQVVSAPETILGKKAMMLINNLSGLAKFISSTLKKFESISEMINRLVQS